MAQENLTLLEQVQMSEFVEMALWGSGRVEGGARRGHNQRHAGMQATLLVWRVGRGGGEEGN